MRILVNRSSYRKGMVNREKKLILWLDEIGKQDVNLVGGKNANLGELYQHLVNATNTAFPQEKIQVPFGFAITTYAYTYFLHENAIHKKINEIIGGLNTRNLSALTKASQQIQRLIVSSQLPNDLEEEIIAAYAKLAKEYNVSPDMLDVAVRSSATSEDLVNASFAGQQESYLNVQGKTALLLHVKKAFASLFTPRAISYRTDQKFNQKNIALSVTVQKMARSDRGVSGVMFTLDTETGFRNAVLINASYGLGEYIVKGIVTPDEYMVFKPTLAKGFPAIINKKLGDKRKKLVYGGNGQATKNAVVSKKEWSTFALSDEQILQLARWGYMIEQHYQKPMDIEWAYDATTKQLFIVQARPETVEATKSAAFMEEYVLEQTGKILTQGTAVGAKIGQGKAHIIHSTANLAEFKKGEVLVTEITDPDWEPVMKMASAIVTNAGGRTSHAAIVSRELGIPAVVGCGNATKVIPTGKPITVSCAEGETGVVYAGVLKFHRSTTDLTNFTLPKTQIKMIIANPALAFRYSQIPNNGVGLMREEFIISNFIKVHPNALIQYNTLKNKQLKKQIDEITNGYTDRLTFYIEKLAYGIGMITAAFYPHDVLLRFSDFKSNEYAGLIGGSEFEPKEENPMMGWRGASRYYDKNFQEAFTLECKAVKIVREKMGLTNLQVMVPFCRTPEEGKKVRALLQQQGLTDVQVWVMAEIPANILQADEFAEIFDGFSIGSNDLTQLTLGLDRDSKLIAHIGNEKNPSVMRLIHELITKAHQKGLKVGICGQGPSDFPDFAKFLVEEGIDSMSLSPDAVIKTALMVKSVEEKV